MRVRLRMGWGKWLKVCRRRHRCRIKLSGWRRNARNWPDMSMNLKRRQRWPRSQKMQGWKLKIKPTGRRFRGLRIIISKLRINWKSIWLKNDFFYYFFVLIIYFKSENSNYSKLFGINNINIFKKKKRVISFWFFSFFIFL